MRIGSLNAVYAQSLTTADTAEPGTVPSGVLYTGRLEDGGVPITGSRGMIFRLFNSASGGTPLYESNGGVAFSVSMVGGIFGVVLDIPINALVGQTQKYIEVEIEGTVLTPRDPLASVPFAKVAQTVEGTIDISTGGLTVSNGAGAILYVSSMTGRVGIGTENPNGRLSISSTAAGGTATGLEMVNPSAAVNTGQRIVFNFDTGGALDTYGAIEAVRESAGGDTRMAFYTRAAGAPGERLRIDKDGNVGINETNPAAALHVNATMAPGLILDHPTQPVIMLRRAGANVMAFQHGGSSATITTLTATDLVLMTNGLDRLHIEAGGDVGVGVSNPSYNLEVGGDFRARDVIEVTSGGTAATPVIRVGGDADTGLYQSAGNELRAATGGVEALRIDSSGDVGIGGAAPGGAKLKVVGGDVVIGNPVGTGGSANSDLFIEGNLIVDGQSIQTGASRFDQLGVATDTITGQLFKVGKGTMTVLEGGQVGIGLTNPGVSLEISAASTPGMVLDHASNPQLQIRRNGINVLQFEHTGALGNVGTQSATDFVLETGGVERLRIKSGSGRVGISSATPADMLSVEGNANINGTLVLGTQLSILNGGTNATTQANARTSLDIPQRNGAGATGTWPINISLNAATATQFAVDPSNCGGSTFPKGVNALGQAQNCIDILADDESLIEGTIYDSDNDLGVYNKDWIVATSNLFDIAFDTNSPTDATFYVDSSANRVGIGTTGPAYKLDVQGDINATGVLRESGVAVMPAGLVMFFTGTSCPGGWTQLPNSAGRYILGRVTSTGTLVGTPLTEGENRAAGVHNHTFTGVAVPAHSDHTFTGNPLGNHSHTFTGNAVPNHTHTFTGVALANHSHTFTGNALGNHSHSVNDPGHSHDISTAGNIVDSGSNRATVGSSAGATSSSNTTGITLNAASAGTPTGTISSDSAGTPSGSNSNAGGHTPGGSISSDSAGTPSGTVNSGGAHTPSGTVNNSAGTAGTNAPYITLMVCSKN